MIKTVTVPRPTATEGQDSSTASSVSQMTPAELKELDDAFDKASNVGRKNDTGKLRYDLICPEWEEGLADILTGAPGVGGAGEYGDRNWELGLDVSRCYAALRRHIAAWIRGEDNDPKSGKSHLFHANACLMFLWAMPRIHPERDDRAAIQVVRSVQKLNVATPTEQEDKKRQIMPKPTPYHQFRTGLTYQEVSDMIWSYSDDPANWHSSCAKTIKYKKGQLVKTPGRRHTILGKWHEIKQEMYRTYLTQFEQDDVLPF